MVTPNDTLHSFLVGNGLRKSDEVRRFKSELVRLTREPFWDSCSKQPPDCSYFLGNSDIRGSSLAEACERDKIVVSFLSSSTSSNPLNVLRNGINTLLSNLTRVRELTELLWDQDRISFETYLKMRFSKSKLNFLEVDEKAFSGILPTEQSLFIDTFKKFEELGWDRIHIDKGLDYKEYHGIIDHRYRYRAKKTCKFRVSRKFRCHGYRKGNSFVVIGFETDHKSSDKG
uniref:Uncharacterized protein n=1 Tax=Candidatus Kentrum sp. MB TaxID=2138164 RepID=A0A451BFF9_9GAMM|nr:MAG: hypothetical protein BECKMB1821G_GA0114241_10914 [Candidatus Kentron sp. MB]VFK34886.1 MAG: hypothetical protein BECKMB1821I_GA0114274_10894 [Candidatus Kentron sp. MB]VFK77020.1 MAG: hypothetical protein BECKMB1821H_GA0114242_10914 [Candidatus Kentron sp. MB]